jgi:phosphatidylglycerophosphate synthase
VTPVTTRPGPRPSDPLRVIHAHLLGVQKPSLGAPLYSLLVNRRAGRVIATLAYRAGLSPNAVTAVSAVLSAAAIAVLVTVRPGWGTGVVVALLLALGYAVDSADGQVARLSGRSSPAGEWLDHMVDAVKTSALHLAVLVACSRFDWAFGAGAQAWLLVPIGYCVVASAVFFGMTLVEQLRRARSRGGPAGRPSLARTLLILPVDYGLMCVVFVLWGSGTPFAVGYSLLFVGNCLFLLTAVTKWFRDLSALGPPAS